jgi:hypothetical protein
MIYFYFLYIIIKDQKHDKYSLYLFILVYISLLLINLGYFLYMIDFSSFTGESFYNNITYLDSEAKIKNTEKVTNTICQEYNSSDKQLNNSKIEFNYLQDLVDKVMGKGKLHIPSHFQPSTLPKTVNSNINDSLPLLTERRGVISPTFSIKIPNNNYSDLSLDKQLESVINNIEKYSNEMIKFNNILYNIENGTEKFYPKESKMLFNQYREALPYLIDDYKSCANNIVSEIKKINPSFIPPKY